MRPFVSAAVCLIASVIGSGHSLGQEYVFDPAHTSVGFQASHAGISWVYGRFNELEGQFTIASDPTQSSFELSIATESIDTGNQQRDDHLRSPDFFNANQFPTITFESTSVTPNEQGLEVTGDLTIHGVSKSVKLQLKGGKKAELPPGTKRIGFTTVTRIKRTDFGMDSMLQAVGDEVQLVVSFEGIEQ